jgi:hypothetical protein
MATKESLRASAERPGSKAPAWETAIKSKIETLRRLERKAFGPRHGKTDFYDYLKAIYKRWDWTDPQESARVGRRVAKLYEIDTRKNKSPIRIVIDATSNTQDRQEKSEWTRALEYAVAKRAAEDGLKKFLKKNGGVSGCAKKMAALRKEGRLKRRSPKTHPWNR